MSFGKCGSYIYPFNCCNPKSASIQPTSQKTKHTEPTSLETKATEPTVKDKEDAALKIQSFYRGNRVRRQIEIDKVISTLKKGGTPEKDVNKIRERLYKSLEYGNLDLSYCQISDEILSQIRPLLSVLNIKELDLYYNNIESEGAIALAEALETNTSIKKLDLGGNHLRDAGAIALAEALKINTSLTHLYLKDNNIGTEGATALAEALKINTSLTTLDLYYNNIESEGAIALAEALKINTSLKGLHIGSNKIGPAGAIALAEALAKNKSLTRLDLYYNNIESEGTTAIAKALEENKSLTKLNLWDNNLGPDLDEKIKKELDINKKIASIEKEALIKTMILTKRLINKKVSGPKGFLGPLVMSFIIGDFISEDAFQKLQTISERKYLAAATTIQKIVRGHQVRIKQDPNPSTGKN